MITGIKIFGASDVKIIDCGFSGMDIAIDVVDSKNISLHENDFGDSRIGVKAKRVDRLAATNNIHGSQPIAIPQPSHWNNVQPPAVWRRWELSPHVYHALYGN
jgi:hypothetical protein